MTERVGEKFPGLRFLPGRRWEDLSDAQLVERAKTGSQPACEELVERHRRRIYNLALRMVGPDQAPDILQETFLELVRSLEYFRGEASVGSWLYRIAYNRCLDLLRQRKTRPAVSLDGMAEAGSWQPSVDPPDPARVEERERVLGALAELAPEHRAVVVLRDLQGLSYEEIAQATGVPTGTVKSRLARARANLAKQLGACLPDRFDGENTEDGRPARRRDAGLPGR